jgi:ATP-binding cassette, subfamily B, bacterial IrtA/YbtP
MRPGASGPDGSGITFDDVHFGYQPDQPVLHATSAELRPGTMTALVGPSGAGKTTLARLVPRFDDVSAGAVRIGGVDVRDIAGPDLISRISIVFQDVPVRRLHRGQHPPRPARRHA